MNRIDEFDNLRNEDWSQVYADVPDSVNIGVQLAFARIHRHERRRKMLVRSIACAACLALVLGIAGSMLRRGSDAPDRVAAPNVQLKVLTGDSLVYAAQADPCFHVHSACSSAMAEQVQLPLMTALEFRKEICPVCGANVQIQAN